MERTVSKGYVSRQEVIEYLGINKDTFYKYFAHKLNGYLIGKRIKYKLEDVDRIIKKI